MNTLLKKIRDGIEDSSPGPPYKAFKELKDVLYPENIPEQIALGCLVQHWRETGRLHFKPGTLPEGRLRRKKVNYYKLADIAALLGGRSPTTVWKEIRSEGNQTQKPVGPPEPTVGAAPVDDSAARRSRGHPQGKTAKRKQKEKLAIEFWKKNPDESIKKIAEAARMHRPDASKLIKQYKRVLQKTLDEGAECLTIGEREFLEQFDDKKA